MGNFIFFSVSLLELKRRPGERFTATLCRIDDQEEDREITSYKIDVIFVSILDFICVTISNSKKSF